MTCVDGFVIPAPTGKKQAFIDQACEFDTMRMQFGALRIMKCWVERPDKATRDAGFVQVEAPMTTDPRLKDRPMAFDGKRLIFRGISPVV